ncbi:hypothetical protein ACFSQ7_20065 [Paenibacillus rhizoplanae]
MPEARSPVRPGTPSGEKAWAIGDKLQLEQLLHQLLSRSNNTSGNAALQTASTLLSWSIYGVTYRWNKEGRQETPCRTGWETGALNKQRSIHVNRP